MTIKEARLAKNLTQQAVSEYLGISKRNIENWETGKRKCPDWCEKLIIDKILSYNASNQYTVIYADRQGLHEIFSSDDYNACEEERINFSKKINPSVKGITEDCYVVSKAEQYQNNLRNSALNIYLSKLTPEEKSEIVEIDGRKFNKAVMNFAEFFNNIIEKDN
jgi:transcriptional regulator with XRE-family HTH domain